VDPQPVAGLHVRSAGAAIEIYKDVGRPRAFVERFDIAGFRARRLATRGWRPGR
jgi:hypothetical protein